MATTPNLALPYLMAAQAQKHVTHNEAIRALDAIVQIAVVDRDLASPPGSPADGSRYIVAASPTAAWSSHAGEIAAWQDGAWMFHVPREGWVAWVADEDQLFVYDGSAWTSIGGGGGSVNPTPLVGVNATADASHRLAVSSPACLFDHEGDDHRLAINKAAGADTASVVLQVGYSGRAELGLAGDDDFHVKVSADGSTWKGAIVVDRTTGAVAMPFTPAVASANPSLLINGDFQLNQRGFAGGSLSAGAYGFDRWKADTGGASLSLSGFVVSLASGTIVQAIEPAVWGLSSLASMQVTVSVADPSADLTVTVGTATGTITAGSGRRSVTITTNSGDTGNLPVKIAKASGSGVTFGRVKLELGASATSWQPRPQPQELALAYRYFEKSYALATAPGTVTVDNCAFGRDTSTGQVRKELINTRFRVEKRTTPTITWYSTKTGSSGQLWYQQTDSDVAVTSTEATGTQQTGYPLSATAADTWLFRAQWTADAEA